MYPPEVEAAHPRIERISDRIRDLTSFFDRIARENRVSCNKSTEPLPGEDLAQCPLIAEGTDEIDRLGEVRPRRVCHETAGVRADGESAGQQSLVPHLPGQRQSLFGLDLLDTTLTHPGIDQCLLGQRTRSHGCRDVGVVAIGFGEGGVEPGDPLLQPPTTHPKSLQR